MENNGLLKVELTVPNQKIVSAAMLVVEQYKPLVEEALIEAQEELLTNETYKNAIKEEIKKKLKEKIEKSLIEEAAYAAQKAINSIDMINIAKKILKIDTLD